MKTIFFIIFLFFSCVILLFLSQSFFNYFYPVKFQNEVNFSSENNRVEKEIIYSFINVESGFNENSVSNKGAVGLMQIMPSTAEWIALKKGEVFETDDLKNPKINIEYGSFYIAYLIDYFKDFSLAVCAYNAGMGNVKSWLKNPEYSSNGKELHKIPFKETEDYINKIKKNLRHYEKRV